MTPEVVIEELLNRIDERFKYLFLAIGAVLALLLIKKLTTEWLRAYRLILRFRRGLRTGGHWSAALLLAQLMVTDRKLFSEEKLTLLRRARILCEHEIFDPRPVYSWPLAPNDEKSDDPNFEPETGNTGAMLAYARYRDDLKAWQKRMRNRMRPEGNWTIPAETPAELNGVMDAIGHYFDCLGSIGLEGSASDRFICPIEVKTGFITPLHLVTGLLVQFGESWDKILRSFDTNSYAAGHYGQVDSGSMNVRQIQLFSYFCWLSWGPSIPVCGCRNWDSTFGVVQFGYGDENNSIEVIGSREEIGASLAALLARQESQERARHNDGEREVLKMPHGGMAAPAKAIGQLRLSRSLGAKSEREVDRLPPAALASWCGEQDQRPLLFISDVVPTNVVEEETQTQDIRRGEILADPQVAGSRYYSAYLWTAFVLLEADGEGEWAPVSELRTGKPSWRDLFVYFEHGNLADTETCKFGKRQLARKAIAGLCEALVLDPQMAERNRFAFACAIDESGCGFELAHPEWGGGKRIRAWLHEALTERACWDEMARRIIQDELIRFDFFNGMELGHPYSSCNFPKIIAAHYEEMGA